MGELQQVLQYVDKYLVNANVPLAIVTVIVLQLVKRYLPSPNGEKYKVIPQLSWLLPALAFFIGTALSFGLDPHVGQSVKGKLSDGLQTGAYAIVAWELYSEWIKPGIVDPIINRFRLSST